MFLSFLVRFFFSSFFQFCGVEALGRKGGPKHLNVWIFAYLHVWISRKNLNIQTSKHSNIEIFKGLHPLFAAQDIHDKKKNDKKLTKKNDEDKK